MRTGVTVFRIDGEGARHLREEVARELGITLVGAVRGERMNIYSGEERIGHDL